MIHYLLDQIIWDLRLGGRRNQIWTYTPKRAPIPLDTFVEIIRRNLEIVGGLARSHHFKVLVAFQPKIFSTQKRLSAHEQEVRRENRPGWKDIMRIYLPCLAQTLKAESRKNGRHISPCWLSLIPARLRFFMMNAMSASAATGSSPGDWPP